MQEPRNVVEHGLRRAIVSVAVIAAMIEIIDTTIVNVALPTIQGNLGADSRKAPDRHRLHRGQRGRHTAHAVAAARFGRRNYFVVSIASSRSPRSCAASRALPELVFFRIIQGLAGGGLISTAQTILADTYPRSDARAGTGIFAMGVIVGPAVGPVLGGFITDDLSWRWAFFVNLPIGSAGRRPRGDDAARSRKTAAPQFDAIGLSLLASAWDRCNTCSTKDRRYDWFDDLNIRLFTALAVVGMAALSGGPCVPEYRWSISRAQIAAGRGGKRPRRGAWCESLWFDSSCSRNTCKNSRSALPQRFRV